MESLLALLLRFEVCGWYELLGFWMIEVVRIRLEPWRPEPEESKIYGQWVGVAWSQLWVCFDLIIIARNVPRSLSITIDRPKFSTTYRF